MLHKKLNMENLAASLFPDVKLLTCQNDGEKSYSVNKHKTELNRP